MTILNGKNGMGAPRPLGRGDHELSTSVYVEVLVAKPMLARLPSQYR
jgi:hypothetical protein